MTEEEMQKAHRHGVERASEEFASQAKYAMDVFADAPAEQFSYLAGFISELRRIATAKASEYVPELVNRKD